MTTYVYEFTSAKTGETPRYIEIKQGMNDPALTKHPDTGEPIRRVIFGGYAALSSASDTGASSSCGPTCGCH